VWAAIASVAVFGCAPPRLPEGQYFGLVAERATVETAAPGGAAPSHAWTVKLDDGRRMTVVQAAPMFSIGQRVRIVTGDGPARMVIP
jgi:outer membrane lipoprotein SlyB